MKLSKIFLMIAVFIMQQSVSHAQFGGLINKAKNNVKNKLTETRSNTGTSSNSGNTVSGNTTAVNAVQKLSTETKWEIASDNGYSGSSGSRTYEMLVRYEKSLAPYFHIRKVGEQGVLHFAKDYPELKGITEPEIKNAVISFSSKPYKAGNSDGAAQFSSGGNHIYARLSISGATIKEAFRLSDENYKLNVDYHIYPAEGDAFKIWKGQATIYLNAAQMNKSTLDFDILPSPDNITVYNDPMDKYMFYISSFAYLHSNEFFPKSGNYKIGIKISAPAKDEWGNNTGKTMETMGFFDYAFEVKDAKTVFDEGQVVRKAIQSGIRFSAKPMPKEWKMPPAAPAVAGYTAAKYNELYSKFYKNVKIIKTYLSPVAGAAWKVIMSSDNVMPAYKYCTQTVFFFVKDAAGNCYYHPCDLRQDYAGGGTYGNIYLAVFDEEKVYVSCDEMR